MREQAARVPAVDQFSAESDDLVDVAEGASRRIALLPDRVRGERRDFSGDPTIAKIPH